MEGVEAQSVRGWVEQAVEDFDAENVSRKLEKMSEGALVEKRRLTTSLNRPAWVGVYPSLAALHLCMSTHSSTKRIRMGSSGGPVCPSGSESAEW